MLLGDDKREPTRFRLVWTREMGANRKTGSRKPGFIDSVLSLIESFYGSVVQNVTPSTPKAPKITQSSTAPASVDDDDQDIGTPNPPTRLGTITGTDPATSHADGVGTGLTPLACRRHPGLRDDARERIALTPEQVGKLWAGCDGEWFGAMFRTMVATGIRPGEAAGMHDGDADLDGAVIEVRHGRSRDASGRSVPVDSLKMDHSHRFVELSPGTVEVLRKHRVAIATERLASGGSWPDVPRLVFPDRDGRFARSEVVSAELAALCKTVGVPIVRPNELRHTEASLAVDAGVPLDQVSDMLGHKDMRMVTQTYRHKVRPTVGAGSAAIMDQLLAETNP